MHKVPLFWVTGNQALFILPIKSRTGNRGKNRNPDIGNPKAVNKTVQVLKILPPKTDIYNK